MKIVLPYPPSLNHYWRMARGHMHISNEGRAYKQAAGLNAVAAGLRPVAGAVGLKISVFRPQRRGDLDNTLKVVLDSLKGIAYHDDSQIDEILAWRHDDKVHPRVEIEIVQRN